MGSPNTDLMDVYGEKGVYLESYGGCAGDGLGGTKVLVDRRTLQNP